MRRLSVILVLIAAATYAQAVTRTSRPEIKTRLTSSVSLTSSRAVDQIDREVRAQDAHPYLTMYLGAAKTTAKSEGKPAKRKAPRTASLQ